MCHSPLRGQTKRDRGRQLTPQDLSSKLDTSADQSWCFPTVPFGLDAAVTSRQVCRVGEIESFLFTWGLHPVFTAIICRNPERKWWGAEQEMLPSSATQRAEIFVPGHLSAFVCALIPQPPSGLSSYGDTDHGREPLPPRYIYNCKCHPGGHTCIWKGWQIPRVYI